MWLLSSVVLINGSFLLNRVSAWFNYVRAVGGMSSNRLLQIPTFSLPTNPEEYTDERLEQINRNSPVRYFRCPGKKLGIEIDSSWQRDGQRLNVSDALHFLTACGKYNHVSKIIISNMSGDGSELLCEQFRLDKLHDNLIQLTQITFHNCVHFTRNNLDNFLLRANFQSLKCLDLTGCISIILGDQDPLFNHFCLTGPNGETNQALVEGVFSGAIAHITQEATMGVLEEKTKQFENELLKERTKLEKLGHLLSALGSPDKAGMMAEIDKLLLELGKSKEGINLQSLQQEHDMVNAKVNKYETDLVNMHSLRLAYESPVRDIGLIRGLISNLKTVLHTDVEFDNVVDKYLPDLCPTEVQVDLSNSVLSDETCSKLFKRLIERGVRVKSLVLSGSIIVGKCLFDAVDLKVERLELANSVALDAANLNNLNDFHQLKYLDLTSSVSGEHNVRFSCKKLEHLVLDGCSGFELDDLRSYIAGFLPSLECLSLVGGSILDGNVTKQAGDLVEELVKSGVQHKNKHFCLFTGNMGAIRADLVSYPPLLELEEASSYQRTAVVNYLETVKEDLREVFFRENSRLFGEDFSENGILDVLTKVESIGFVECETIEPDVMRHIHKLKLQKIISQIRGIRRTVNMAVEAGIPKVHIDGNIDAVMMEYLMDFARISEISMSGYRHITQEDLHMLGEIGERVHLERLHLANTNVQREDLETSEGEPAEFLVKLFRANLRTLFCDVEGHLFKNWRNSLGGNGPLQIVLADNSHQVIQGEHLAI
jgi:hypothetical protein